MFGDEYPAARHLSTDGHSLYNSHRQEKQWRSHTYGLIGRQQYHQGWDSHEQHAENEHTFSATRVAEVCHDDSARRTWQVVTAAVNLLIMPVQILNGCWRIPFLVGGLLGLISMRLRRWLAETPVFEQMRARAEMSRELPLRAVLRSHWIASLISMVSTWTTAGTVVVVILMTPALLENFFALPAREMQLANLAATAALFVSTIVVGGLTNRFGVRRVAVPMLVLLTVATYMLYWSAARIPSIVTAFYLLAGIGAGAVALTPRRHGSRISAGGAFQWCFVLVQYRHFVS